MPRTAITVTDTSRGGTNQPAVQTGDNTNGMALSWNDGRIILELSAVTATTTFTINFPGNVDGQGITARTYAVTTATPVIAGPFPPATYNQADGTVQVDISSANGRLRAYHLP